MNTTISFLAGMILLLIGYFQLKKSVDIETAIVSIGYFEGSILFIVFARCCNMG